MVSFLRKFKYYNLPYLNLQIQVILRSNKDKIRPSALPDSTDLIKIFQNSDELLRQAQDLINLARRNMNEINPSDVAEVVGYVKIGETAINILDKSYKVRY